jgi:hypothetical protein
MGDFAKNNFAASLSMGTGDRYGILLRVTGTLLPDKREAFRQEFAALANKYSLAILTFDVKPDQTAG